MAVRPEVFVILAATYGADMSSPIKVFGHWAVCENGIYGLASNVVVPPEWYGIGHLVGMMNQTWGASALGFDRALAFARELKKGKVAA